MTAVHPAPGFDETTLLRLAAGLERSSEHPLARALVRAAEARGLPLSAAEDFDSPVGKRVAGRIEGRAVLIGSAGFLEDNRIDAGPMAPTADALRQAGATAIFMAMHGVLAGVFAIADPIKATCRPPSPPWP